MMSPRRLRPRVVTVVKKEISWVMPCFLRAAFDFLASPNHIAKYPVSVILAHISSFLWIAILIGSIMVNKSSTRCKDEKDNGEKAAYMLAVSLALPLLVYLFISIVCRYFRSIGSIRQSDANRAKLAICTPGLCRAQKKRIAKSNMVIDLIVCFFESAVIIARFSSLWNHCTDDNRCIIPCELQIWITPCLSFFIFAAMAVFLKSTLVSSEFDYCVESRVFETYQFKDVASNPLFRWIYSTELRQRFAIPLCILFVGTMIIESTTLTLAVTGWDHSTFRGWGIQALTMSGILLAVDGGIVFLPGTIYSFLRTSYSGSTRRTGILEFVRSPLLLKNLPRRKAVVMLFIISFAFAFNACLNSYLGGPSEQHFIFSISILTFTLFVFLCQLLVSDMPASVKDLLLYTAEENYGLVMSRKSFVKELRKASEKNRPSLSPLMDDIEICVPTYLASQARIELSVVVSYRWSDEKVYLKKGMSNSSSSGSTQSQYPVIRLRHSSCSGFDWIVVLMQSQLDALLKDLTSAREPYVWIDQFSIPQVNYNASTHDSHEIGKQAVRAVLIPKMTGLYSCAGRVSILNNSGDEQLMEEDWYQNRLWCMQEYCFPANASIHPLVSSASEQVLRERMQRVGSRWFGSSGNQECLDIVLDWMVPDPKVLNSKIEERVQAIGSIEYLELVGKMAASDTNDTLSALAQPWFGLIMTSDLTKVMLVRHIVANAMRNGKQEVELISNPLVDSQSWKFSGSMTVDRMLSSTGRGMERGPPMEVRSFQFSHVSLRLHKCTSDSILQAVMNGHAVHDTGQGYEYSGQLIQPAGFEGLLTVLQFQKLSQDVEFEGASRPAFHLVSMKVTPTNPRRCFLRSCTVLTFRFQVIQPSNTAIDIISWTEQRRFLMF
jgi:hypothetical protein